MCGVVGYWKPRATEGADSLHGTVTRMSDSLVHRGPDAGGSWIDAGSGVALGHRRLSILDLTPHGAQPMATGDHHHVLTFNGEIYNHLEVRREIGTPTGGSWRGHSDTETLAEAIATFGFEGALARVKGMFAFAVWDSRRRVLRLAVDRMGEKPLYYGTRQGEFFFASEPKAFKAVPGWNPEVSRESLALLLRFNSIPAPHSIWNGVHKLEAGTFLEVSVRDSGDFTLRTARYWDLREVAKTSFANRFRGDDREATNELESRLREVIGRQMVADVPLGAFLSGGVDSSTVVALMQAQSSRPVSTFTIGFESRSHNEADDARRVATHLGTRHTEERLDWKSALDLIPRLPEVWSEPFADSSQLPTLLVAQLARRHVTVSLSGDAGDEVFGGYNRYVWANGRGRDMAGVPLILRQGIAALLRLPSPKRVDSVISLLGPLMPRGAKVPMIGDKLQKVAAVLGASDMSGVYRELVSQWPRPAELLPGVIEPAGWMEDSVRWDWCPDPVERMQVLDMLLYLPTDILTKVDRASMAVSLESRVPFLDPDLIAFALSLPLHMKIRGGKGKWLLREVLYRHVPRELIERPKMGFAIPLDAWLRGPLKDWAAALLDEGRLRREGYFRPEPVLKAWAEHLSGKANRQHALWTILMFQSWLEHQGGAA
jgi:asparagine synthase (glutamine-hydrolysing)